MDSLSPRDLTPQERKRAYNRAYYQARREEIQKQQKVYREAHADEIKAYGEQWRESHREHNKEYARLDRQANGESINAHRRIRYRVNPDPLREASKVYARAHAEERRAQQRAYRDAHPELLREKDRRYRQAHPEQVRAMFKGIKARRRTRKTQAGGSYTVAEWRALKTQYNNTCLCCGKREPDIKLTADHVIPVTKLGSSNIENIQPLCGPCNSKKHDKVIDYRLRFQI